jgi:plastocyanin
LTGVDFVGTKTVKVTLRAGKYTFVCVPHSDDMRGGFSVR